MFSLLFPFFGNYAADHIKSAVNRAKLQAVCLGLAGGALFFAVLFICLAIFSGLSALVSPMIAAALIALVWLVIAIISVLCLKIRLDRHHRAREAESIVNDEQKKLLANTALAAAPGLIGLIGPKSLKKLGLIAVLATGAVAAYGVMTKPGRKAK